MRTRRAASVPWPTVAVLIAALAAQLTWASLRRGPAVSVSPLPMPPSVTALRVVSLNEPALAARLMMLWLQAYDYQPGVSLPFRSLDYAAVEAWLAHMLELDPGFQYPLLAAARLYGEVDDAPRQRRMLDFIARSFAADPARRWPWLAHAVYLAKHRLQDPALALRLAETLATADPTAAIPDWARQMRIFVLEDMGELESAKVLLGGLIASGHIVDRHERHFLSERLAELERRSAAAQPGELPPPAAAER